MERAIRETYTELAQVMLIHQANQAGNIHGGEIMKIMDSTAGVCAIKHCGGNAVTARADELQFHHPIYIGNLVTCTATLIFVGKSSMEVLVTVFVEDFRTGRPREKALSGYFTMIALDQNGKPREVAKLKAETEQEKELFEQGRKRYESYKNKLQAKDVGRTIKG